MSVGRERWDGQGMLDLGPIRAGGLRDLEREDRKWWAEYRRQHPPPRAGKGPGHWITPAWTGPDSPQSPVWVSDTERSTPTGPGSAGARNAVTG